MEDRYLRVNQIVGQSEVTEEQASENRRRRKGPRSPRREIKPIIPISRSAWLQGVKDGRYAKPIKFSEKITVWKLSEVLALIDREG